MRSSNRPICQARRLPRRPVSSNWPAATPTGHFPLARRRQRRRATSSLARRLARHVLVRPVMGDSSEVPVVLIFSMRRDLLLQMYRGLCVCVSVGYNHEPHACR